MGPTYTHKPLEESFSTRLLLLEPAATPDLVLRCSLVETPLDSPLEYTALSYTWDAQSPSCPIECGDGILSVTPNCWAALRRLRDEKERRKLWIDGICIDQTSMKERSQQVALMGDIYKKAQTVVIWLGEGDDRVEIAMTQLREIGRLNEREPTTEDERKERTDVLALVFDTRTQSSKGILEPAFELSWFYRMWTVQEATLPDVENILVHYGPISFPWLHLLLTMSMLKITEFKWGNWDQATLLQRSISTMFIEKRDPSWGGLFGVKSLETLSYRSLLGMLAAMRPKKATDPRDKVFALYAVANELGLALPLPDYEKSLRQTYIDTAIACVEQDRNLNILYEAPSDKRDPSLPSWVPDWSDEGATRTYLEYLGKGLRAGGSDEPRWSLSNDYRSLTVRGRIVDSVDACGAMLNFDKTLLDGREMMGRHDRSFATFQQELANAVDVMRGWVDMTPSCSNYPTGASIKDALRSCLTEARSTLREYDSSWEAWIRFMRTSKKQTPYLTFLRLAAGFEESSAWEFNNTVVRQVMGKCFFRTKNGYFGLAMRYVEVGDHVALLQGFEMPFILRNSGEGHEVVAYGSVHGMMNGELWDEQGSSEIMLQ